MRTGILIVWILVTCITNLGAADLPKSFVLSQAELKRCTPQEGKEPIRSLPAGHALISGDRDKIRDWFRKPTIYLGNYGPKVGKFAPAPIDLLEQKALAYFIEHGGRDFQLPALGLALKLSYSLGVIEKPVAQVFRNGEGETKQLAARVAMRHMIKPVYPELRAYLSKAKPKDLALFFPKSPVYFHLVFEKADRKELKTIAKAAAPLLAGQWDANVRMSMATVLRDLNPEDRPIPEIVQAIWLALVNELQREERDDAVCELFIHRMRRPHMTVFPRDRASHLLEICLFDPNDKVAQQAAWLRYSVLLNGKRPKKEKELDIYLPFMHHATSLDKSVAARAAHEFKTLGQKDLIEIAKLIDGSSATFTMTRKQYAKLSDELLPLRISWAMSKKAKFVSHAEKKKAEAAYWKAYKPKVYKTIKVKLADE